MQKKTLAQSKTESFISEFVRRGRTDNFIHEMRLKYDIPEKGFAYDAAFAEGFVNKSGKKFEIDDSIVVGTKFQNTYESFSRLFVECHSYLMSENYFNLFVTIQLTLYVLFSRFYNGAIREIKDGDMLTHFFNIRESLDSLDDEDPQKCITIIGQLEHIAQHKPLAICFSPEISKRQLKDYIDKIWDTIQQQKPVHKERINSIRVKKNTTANDIVYENRHNKIKDIRGILAKHKIFWDDSQIATVREIEVRKRNTH